MAGDGVDLVDEDDRRSVLPRSFEQLADIAFGLPDPLADHVSAGDGIERRLRLRGEDFRHRRLAGSRRPGEQQACGGLDPKALYRFGILDHPLQLLELCLDGGVQDQRVPRPVLDGRPVGAAVAFYSRQKLSGIDENLVSALRSSPERLKGGRVDDLGDRGGGHALGARHELG